MHSKIDSGHLSPGSAAVGALALPRGPKSGSNAKRVAAGALGTLVRPLRAIKPLDWLVARAFQVWYQMPVVPTHYYSPLPDIVFLKENLHRWYREKTLAGIRINFHRQTTLLNALSVFSAECDRLPNIAWVNAEGHGLGYGEVEAQLLHCMIRYLKPRTIIEVGSGVSTFFSLNALEKNRHENEVRSTMVCIEPHPRPKLRQLAGQRSVTIHERQVQDIEPWTFERLGEGDILFIDSSHVSKVDSDVNFLVLEILPRLKPGVIVHIHDIPFPFMTCPPGHPMFEKSLLWNEPALLRAFLAWNDAFEILMCQSYLHLMYPESIKKVVRIYEPKIHFPSSLWLQKVA